MVHKVGERMTKVGGGVPKLERGAQIGGGERPRWGMVPKVGLDVRGGV